MEDMTIQNGGSYAAAGAPNCTHLVVDEHTVKTIPFEVCHKNYMIRVFCFTNACFYNCTRPAYLQIRPYFLFVILFS